MTLRSKIAMLMAEFLGTAVLTTAVINISRSQIGIGYFVAIGVGLTLSVLALGLVATSGAHFNPAITVGQWTIRKIGTLQAIAYIVVQFLGAIAAWRLNEYFTGTTLTNIAGKSFTWKVMLAEVLGTFVFTFIIAAAIYQGYKGGKLAAAIGGGLFLGIIVSTIASNGILNPAVALGAQSWGRGYIFGPIIGAILGFNLYALLFAPETPWARASGVVRKTVVVPSTPAPATAKASTTAKSSKTTKKAAKKPARRSSKRS